MTRVRKGKQHSLKAKSMCVWRKKKILFILYTANIEEKTELSCRKGDTMKKGAKW